MSIEGPEWLTPRSLDEALRLRAELQEDVTVVAGGTFLGILMNQGFLFPSVLLSLRSVPGLDFVDVGDDGALRLGAMTTHRAVERSAVVRERWPVLARTFSLVASPRVRNQATVGGVLADADYASDPPAVLSALGALAMVRSPERERAIPVEDFIVGPYETALQADELLVEVLVPPHADRAVYRKFRSRSSEDRPCVAVAAVRANGTLRLVVGGATGRPQHFPEVCELGAGNRLSPESARRIASEYASRIEPISDSRGSAEYRSRIIEVEVRRALEDISHD